MFLGEAVERTASITVRALRRWAASDALPTASVSRTPSLFSASLQRKWPTTTAFWKFVFGIFAALAEFERALICERTVAGLAAARARGRPVGVRSR